MHEGLEREDKWAVDVDFALPALDDLTPDGQTHSDAVELTSVYYDTPDYDLRAHGIVMRRRDGDDDTGWQVKLPAPDGRLELHWPLSDTPPEELSRLLAGATLGKELSTAATIRTSRHRHRVTVGDDVRFEIADDTVRASTGADLLVWREIEVELGPGVTGVSKRLRRRLRAAGATRSHYPSKLAHATGQSEPAAPSRAVGVLTTYLHEQMDQIVLGDVELRRGNDPIHDTRVALRRLRSTLRVFGSALQGVPSTFDDELKWFAGLLGEVRDSQVQQGRFAEAVDALPQTLVLGPVASRIRSDLRAIEFPARAAVDEAMQSPRYLAILAVLRQWRTKAPVAVDLPTKTVRRLAVNASAKARRRLDEALSADDPVLLHRARKAAKRARYAAELVAPVDSSARRRVKRHKEMQSILGDYQDAAVATDALRRLAIAAGTTAGENGFTFGLLYAREQWIAADRREQVRALAHRSPSDRRAQF